MHQSAIYLPCTLSRAPVSRSLNSCLLLSAATAPYREALLSDQTVQLLPHSKVRNLPLKCVALCSAFTTEASRSGLQNYISDLVHRHLLNLITIERFTSYSANLLLQRCLPTSRSPAFICFQNLSQHFRKKHHQRAVVAIQ